MTVAEKKRKNMKHLADMNDLEFCEFLTSGHKSLSLRWKLDGFFLRFGKDESGKLWFQTARSPVLYDPIGLIWHSMAKGYDHNAMTRAEHYFHLIKDLWSSNLASSLQNDTGIECEVFHKPMSTLAEGKRTFVNIPYDDSFFKRNTNLGLYRLIQSSTGVTIYDDEFNDSIADIFTFGSKFKVDVDMDYFQKVVLSFSQDQLRSLRSLKHADRPMKLEMKETVRLLKEQFSAYILKLAEEQHRMGDNFEGVVMTINNTEYKITTNYFKTLLLVKGLSSG